ncbi:FAST kinase domain-containing protein 5, mitochondrial isoform X2 [Tachysurus vachellii]|nr:FAST kinase domain-containing protein 5, mitochondrial isoform X2 [Tachysurus vachellii]XP_060719543.1 FAST kinase domain-containing protein 5, mitochondrial isoform X2 [Tachysurus vachellii]XP_060719544.1 FAST kinase domain-containing protein 5, mitochondrial isoform X2 [Tachysurus vachellii]
MRMSARALWRRAATLRACVRSPRWSVHGAQHLCSESEYGSVQQDEKTQTLQQGTENVEGCLLVYNPSAYYQSRAESSAIQGGSERVEETSQPVPSPGFRQQNNRYMIGPSRNLSISKNAQLGFAYNKDITDKKCKFDPPKDKVSMYIKKDTRAFQRCRSEYSTMTHDMSQRPPAIQIKDGLSLLHKAALMKNIDASNVARFICELGRLEPEQTVMVRGNMRFSTLLRYSVENLENFTHLQLIEVLRAFVRLELSHHHNILELYEAEFSRRSGEMELHQLLLIADLWRCLGRSVPQYIDKLCDCVSKHFNQMGPPELVQFVYILGESRQCPSFVLQSVEDIIMRHLEDLKGEEVGAVCLGLFKTQNSLSVGALRRLVDRACVVVKEISDFGIVNVMKLLRFSHLDHLHWLELLSSEVPRRAPQMAVQGLMHIALTCSALHYHDDRVLLAVAKNLPQLPSQYRSKDAAKLLWAFGNLGILPSQCPSLHPRLTQALRDRESEFRSYPEHLLTALLGLAFVGQFPHDLLSLALSPEFTTRVTGLIDLKKDLFTLDGTVAIELPGWTGPRMNPLVRVEVTKQLWDFAQSELCQKPEVLEAEAVLQELLGGKLFVHKRMILPHMRSIDLEVHLDPSGNPLPVAAENYQSQYNPDNESLWPLNWKEMQTGVTLTDDLLVQLTSGKKTAMSAALPHQQPVLCPVEASTKRERILSVGVDLTDDLLHAITKQHEHSSIPGHATPVSSVARLAVQVTSRNHYCYRTQRLTGLYVMKRRQLALSGYTIVEVPHWEWIPLLRRSLAERLAYMHCKIFSSFDSRKRK